MSSINDKNKRKQNSDSININEYMENWLEKVESERQHLSSIDSDSIQYKNKYKNGLHTICKKFDKLKFDEKWINKLLSDKFILFGTNLKCNEKYLTLEMALFNAGYNIRVGGLKHQIIKYIKDLTQWEFLQFLDDYKREKTMGQFTGKWDPYGVKNKNDFIREFKSPHFTLEDDSIMISLISEITNIDFIIFHQNYRIQDLTGTVPRDNIVLLYKFIDDNTQRVFFTCIGLIEKNGRKIKSMFQREKLPESISILLNKDQFIFKHVENIIIDIQKRKERLTLRTIVTNLENTLSCKFSHTEIKGVIKIINCILNDTQFFKCKLN